MEYEAIYRAREKEENNKVLNECEEMFMKIRSLPEELLGDEISLEFLKIENKLAHIMPFPIGEIVDQSKTCDIQHPVHYEYILDCLSSESSPTQTSHLQAIGPGSPSSLSFLSMTTSISMNPFDLMKRPELRQFSLSSPSYKTKNFDPFSSRHDKSGKMNNFDSESSGEPEPTKGQSIVKIPVSETTYYRHFQSYVYMLTELNQYDKALEIIKIALSRDPMFLSMRMERIEIYKMMIQIMNKKLQKGISYVNKRNEYLEMLKTETLQCFPFAYTKKQLARSYRNMAFYFVEKSVYEVATCCLLKSLQYETCINVANELLFIKEKVLGKEPQSNLGRVRRPSSASSPPSPSTLAAVFDKKESMLEEPKTSRKHFPHSMYQSLLCTICDTHSIFRGLASNRITSHKEQFGIIFRGKKAFESNVDLQAWGKQILVENSIPTHFNPKWLECSERVAANLKFQMDRNPKSKVTYYEKLAEAYKLCADISDIPEKSKLYSQKGEELQELIHIHFGTKNTTQCNE